MQLNACLQLTHCAECPHDFGIGLVERDERKRGELIGLAQLRRSSAAGEESGEMILQEILYD